jgi:Arc/MetJ family transcription regulator
MYTLLSYYVRMVRRTTIELDEDLVARAKKALGAKTTRAAVEEALRRAVEIGQRDRDRRAAGQRAYLERLRVRADVKVLNSEEMWR